MQSFLSKDFCWPKKRSGSVLFTSQGEWKLGQWRPCLQYESLTVTALNHVDTAMTHCNTLLNAHVYISPKCRSARKVHVTAFVDLLFWFALPLGRLDSWVMRQQHAGCKAGRCPTDLFLSWFKEKSDPGLQTTIVTMQHSAVMQLTESGLEDLGGPILVWDCSLSRCKSRCKSPCTRQFLQTSQRKRLPGSCAVPRCAQPKNPSNPSWQLRNLFCHHWLIANDAKSYLSELLHPWRLWSSPSETWLSNLCTMIIDPHHGRAAKSFLDFRTPAWRWHCGKPFSQTRLL